MADIKKIRFIISPILIITYVLDRPCIGTVLMVLTLYTQNNYNMLCLDHTYHNFACTIPWNQNRLWHCDDIHLLSDLAPSQLDTNVSLLVVQSGNTILSQTYTPVPNNPEMYYK